MTVPQKRFRSRDEQTTTTTSSLYGSTAATSAVSSHDPNNSQPSGTARTTTLEQDRFSPQEDKKATTMASSRYGSTAAVAAAHASNAETAQTTSTTSTTRDNGQQVAVVNDSYTDYNSEEDEIRRTWKESPFAVGMERDNKGCTRWCKPCMVRDSHTRPICCCPVGRVGNMIVLRQTMEDGAIVIDPTTGGAQIGQTPRLQCVVGPYWPCALFITLPAIVVFCVLTGLSRKDEYESSIGLLIPWLALVGLTLLSLCQVACTDPGILYRHAEPPSPGDHSHWRWNDQALTYRPSTARFDPECGVVIEDFDHTCPWTGTGIGANNIVWFRIFVASIFATMIFNVVLLLYL